jgi:hypothetical protein
MYVTLSNIAIAFIATALLVVMVDRITWAIKEVLPFPARVEAVITYLVLCGIASIVCWQGRFDLFTYLGFNWQHPWEGWVLTGALIAGGSSLLVQQFQVVGLIPTIISGVSSMFGLGGGYTATHTETTPPEDQSGSL